MVSGEVISRVESAVKTLRNKFGQSPYFFYKESDMHCYMYHLLFQGITLKKRSYVLTNRNRVATVQLHKEYPTLGKFSKHPTEDKHALRPDERKKFMDKGKSYQPSRGAYDLAIITPDENTDFDWQKTSVAIEFALNQYHPSLVHFRNDFTKLTYEKDRVERGYILFS